jgi:hypothetical protein
MKTIYIVSLELLKVHNPSTEYIQMTLDTFKTLYTGPNDEMHVVDHPNAYKLYMKPLMKCVNEYCETFDVENKEECFPVDKIEELAKNMASSQTNYIKDKQYD